MQPKMIGREKSSIVASRNLSTSDGKRGGRFGDLPDFVWNFVWNMCKIGLIFGKNKLKKVKYFLLQKRRKPLKTKEKPSIAWLFSLEQATGIEPVVIHKNHIILYSFFNRRVEFRVEYLLFFQDIPPMRL